MNGSLERSSSGQSAEYQSPAVVPAEVRRFGPSKNSVGAPPPGKIPDLEIPSFLKRGPATAEEVGAFA